LDTDVISFWKRVNELIRLKKTKQEVVADACGISYQTFREWITRKAFPDGNDLFHIAQNLGISVEYLMTRKIANGKRLNVNKALQHWEPLGEFLKRL